MFVFHKAYLAASSLTALVAKIDVVWEITVPTEQVGEYICMELGGYSDPVLIVAPAPGGFIAELETQQVVHLDDEEASEEEVAAVAAYALKIEMFNNHLREAALAIL